jgi:hypothetical protein
MTPADVAGAEPDQRVVVDTTPPTITVTPWKADGLGIRCIVSDTNPDHATLKAVCQTDAGEVSMELVRGQESVFRIKGAEWMKHNVKVSVTDKAGNVGTTEILVRDLFESTAVEPRAARAPPPESSAPAAKAIP